MTTGTFSPRRVTVVAPTTRVDVALPGESAIGEVVPQLAYLAGLGSQDPTGQAGGWLLARLGQEPFEPARTVTASGIRDGELLYLMPRSEQLPPAVFDDMIEAVAGATHGLAGVWQATTTRRAGQWLATLAFLGGVPVLALSGLPGLLLAGIALVVALLLLVSAAGLSRALGDAQAAALVAAAALPYGMLSALVTGGGDPHRPWTDASALLPACAGGAVTLVAGAVVVGRYLPWFTGTVAFIAVANFMLLGAVLTGAAPESVAAATIGALLLTGPLHPMLSLRLARLRLPPVPVDVEEFRADREPTREGEVDEAAKAASGHLTGLVAASSAAQVVSAALLLLNDDLWTTLLASVVALTLLLRVRAPLRSRTQRLVPLAGTVVTGWVIGGVALSVGSTDRLLLCVALVATGTAGTIFALRAPGRSPSPYWGRFYDIIEFLALSSVLPLAAQVMDIFGRLRARGG